ncbi:MAG: hypothetical protein GX310_00115 [Synergistaceae bacterium]|nr:hypothetical protein [Synergistaceae bacterium]
MGKKRKEYREPWEYLKEKKVLWKQVLILIAVVAALFAALILGEFLFTYFHLGKDWSDTLLIRMIVERRLLLPFFP